ncbi:hypothetical protein HZQ92_05535 [Elizabethkingia anophelis]|nr:hypothetical protein [Elizabethkingia anophelis]MCT3823044.1 hypothetical protein [Elizabethkingia anophelis]MCT3930362.1 hypothetical protein [Elizabethkingia anophelis]MCT4111984.1 hypothetical protein [Elizabethkingia anophelis]
MEGKELRIGNYIKHSELLGITEVMAVGKDYIHILFNKETLYESIKWFTPIPLTEEWLLKLGFKKSKFSSNCFKITNGYKFDFAGGEVLYLDSIRLEHIKYIHQLQNLHFALGGEELTIKISVNIGK